MVETGEAALSRASAPELDAVLGRRFPVLDDGFVRAVDYMGSDAAIVQAARVSYGQGTRKVHEDRGLIRYLMRHDHTTPFEMCEIKLHVRVPMDCWRQWIRHRTANVNEYSTRYSQAIDAAQRTPASAWRVQSSTGKQGSEGALPEEVGARLTAREADLLDRARAVYLERIEAGVAREQARKDLPLSTYTEAYWKIDLHNLLHFLRLRMDPHAQQEIRQYAEVIGGEIVARWCPLAWEAFQDYRVQGLRLSRVETAVLRGMAAGDRAAAVAAARAAGWLELGPEGLRPNRERREMARKLRDLGLPIPWD
ncbi:MAG TPA: FAD-dependent thymidylate synthase [Candidatus Polarisedimenticolaceae bacterium]|nr:FAD-dependent thymidylate synthase [Candidatus Polarisedimenticolaceae bacterium]